MHGWPGWWAFVAVPLPGQEITVFENRRLSRESSSESAHGPSLMDGEQTFLEKHREPTFVFFQEEEKFEVKQQRDKFFSLVLYGGLTILVGP